MKKIILALLLWIFTTTDTYASLTRTGNENDIETETTAGVALLGGGDEDDIEEVFRWMIEKAGHGDFLVIAWNVRYNKIIYDLGNVNSVETLILTSEEEANSELVLNKVKHAEAIFIGGGSQIEYVDYLKDSKLLAAINEVVNHIPIGGSSAGLAILGEYYYAATSDVAFYLQSEDALKNPYCHGMDAIGSNLLHLGLLTSIITDSHYAERDRQGRHIAFMARLIHDKKPIRGIGVDEDTAVCIDEHGNAKIFGAGNAYFLEATDQPDVCEPDKPLTWEQSPIKVFVGKAGQQFSVKNWTNIDCRAENWYVKEGLIKIEQVA